jgi:hypothetical protein
MEISVLHRRVQTTQLPGGQLDRDGAAAGQRGDRGGQAAVGQDRRGDAAGQRAQLVERLAGLGERFGDCRAGGVLVGVHLVLGAPEVHRQPYQPLLRAVVDVALQPAQRGGLGRYRRRRLLVGRVAVPFQPADPGPQV